MSRDEVNDKWHETEDVPRGWDMGTKTRPLHGDEKNVQEWYLLGEVTLFLRSQGVLAPTQSVVRLSTGSISLIDSRDL